MILEDFPEDQELVNKAKLVLAKYIKWKNQCDAEEVLINRTEEKVLSDLRT